MTYERRELIERFQLWLDTNPRNQIIAAQCATIAEEYAERKIKNLNLHIVNGSFCRNCQETTDSATLTKCRKCGSIKNY